MHKLTQSDIDAVWQFMLAAAPGLAARDELFVQDGLLSGIALQALQARLALRMRLGSEFAAARKDWLEAATALSQTSQKLAEQQAALQAAGSLALGAGRPAQTAPRAPAAFAPNEGVA